jgi:hypothetical protein
MADHSLTLTEDEALVLFEYFSRFDDSGDLSFQHAAEYLALQKISAQVDKTTSAMFKSNYTELLEAARARIAAGFEGEVPCFKPQKT